MLLVSCREAVYNLCLRCRLPAEVCAENIPDSPDQLLFETSGCSWPCSSRNPMSLTTQRYISSPPPVLLKPPFLASQAVLIVRVSPASRYSCQWLCIRLPSGRSLQVSLGPCTLHAHVFCRLHDGQYLALQVPLCCYQSSADCPPARVSRKNDWRRRGEVARGTSNMKKWRPVRALGTTAFGRRPGQNGNERILQ